ncbi:hypothetical protein DSO06_01880 [Candidatus Nezhaarchaeota archaeon WYZ-LMO8]|nr:MAG: hypothetical protein DSO06_01880 [Candidatus Nezhaarchaeota archaeon WYZ-LMO8]TDA36440.1 MAG: hypothetical protein DSO05_03630 [Candidatus Nezhaarchaeota archaeon WYZ-LMO7]
MLRCTKCGFIGDRNIIACINLLVRCARCGGLGVPLNAPEGRCRPKTDAGEQNVA